jgi:AcrR family transcriptional regulator
MSRDMATVKPDRRVERTRKVLQAAFVDLMLSEGYAALTVDAIARRADVGRSTFYMHFRSREDMLLHSLEHPSARMAVLVRGDVAPDAVIPLLEHFREQKRLNRVVFDWPVREIWIRCLARLIEAELRRQRRKSALPLPLVATQIAQSQIALIATWLLSWQQMTARRVAEALIATTNANVAALAWR